MRDIDLLYIFIFIFSIKNIYVFFNIYVYHGTLIKHKLNVRFCTCMKK